MVSDEPVKTQKQLEKEAKKKDKDAKFKEKQEKLAAVVKPVKKVAKDSVYYTIDTPVGEKKGQIYLIIDYYLFNNQIIYKTQDVLYLMHTALSMSKHVGMNGGRKWDFSNQNVL
jgi:hypothetical protein